MLYKDCFLFKLLTKRFLSFISFPWMNSICEELSKMYFLSKTAFVHALLSAGAILYL